jgi:hypothetical protein
MSDRRHSSGERFLVVRLTALGDILHTVPAVAALRAAHPRAKIDWVVERKWAPVIEGSPAIDEVIPFDRRAGTATIAPSIFRGYTSRRFSPRFPARRAASASTARGPAKMARRCSTPSA